MWWLDPGKEVLNVLFNRILAPYVENLDLNQVNYGIGQGRLTLRNLRLKKGALDKFRLPVDVLEGYLGTFTLSLHWRNLGNQPVEIFIENVYLLVVPSSQSNLDPAEEEQRVQAAKAERLENAELLHMQGQAETSSDNSSQPQGFWESLTAKIINNIQVTIKNIHIRYEDSLSVPGHPFSAGVTLASFTAVSVNHLWEQAFIESTAGAIHKLANLQSLAVYFDTDSSSMAGFPPAEAIAKFTAAISHGNDASEHQFILKPVSGEGRITVNHKMSNETPRFDVELSFDEIGVGLDNAQYRDIISLLDMYQIYMRQRQYRKYRPQVEFSSSPARSRLIFALTAILEGVKERNRKWTWAHFAERRDDRKRYVELFQRKLANMMMGSDSTDLQALERKLTYEDIRFYRSIARSRFRKDSAVKKLQAESKQAPQTSSWTSWLWSSSATPSEQESNFAGPMTDEQRKQLYEVLDYDEKAALMESLNAPRDSLKARIAATLNKGTFALKKDPHGVPLDVVSIVFDIFRANVIQRPDNIEASISLGGFGVFDGTTKDTIYPKIVYVKDKDYDDRSVLQNPPTEPFFFVKFEKNPLDERADSALTVRMRHMEIIYHRGYVEAVYHFLKPPASQMESVEALLNVASETLEGFRKETRAGLEFALQTHKTIDIQMDIHAPVIIIPENVNTNASSHLIVDAGHISIQSELADKSAIRLIHQKRNQVYNDDDYRQLEELMYDKLTLKLRSAQFIVGHELEACRKALVAGSSDNLHLLEGLDIDLQVQNSIVPTALNLPRFKVSGKLPTLQVNMSDAKYKALMRLIDVCIPRFGESPDSRPKPIPTTGFQLPSNIFASSQTEYVIDDNDSDDGDDDDDDESAHGDLFFEADEGPREDPELHQHIFEFHFEVDSLGAKLYKASSEGEDRLLGDASLRQFALKFVLAKYDMKVDLRLRSVAMNLQQPGSNALTFISSQGSAQEENKDLLSLKYCRVQKDSPEFVTIYEGLDQTVDVKISTFVFRVAPEPVLALYDFIMTTFVPNSPQPSASSPSTPGSESLVESSENKDLDSKIRVQLKLAQVQIVLVTPSMDLATLSLSTADAGVLVRPKTLRVSGRLGSLSLTNSAQNYALRSEFKQILSIDGQNFADFQYQTYDPDDASYPGFKSSVNLNAASLRLHFLEQPLHDIYLFFLQFAKLKGLYDAATEVAVQRASEMDQMKFDISVKTPILVLPSDASSSLDALVMRLGEIQARNSLTHTSSTISASLRGIQLISQLYQDKVLSTLKIIDDIDISAEIVQRASKMGVGPATQVSVRVSDVRLHLTQQQYRILLGLLVSIPRVFVNPETAQVQPGSRLDMSSTNGTPTVDLQPELRLTTSEAEASNPLSVDLVVSVSAVKLHLYDAFASSEETLKEHGIARFALNDNTLRLKLLADGSGEAQVVLRSFTVGNTRPGHTKFREIIPAAQHEREQFMFLYSFSGTPGTAVAILTVDSPKIIFALDPLVSLLQFFVDVPASPPLRESNMKEWAPPPETIQKSSLDFRIDLHDVAISILEDDTDPDSQSIKLSVKQILLSQQGIIALTVNNLGMSLARMGTPEESVRFLDNVDLTVSLDNRSSDLHQTMSIEVNSKPIIFRASYRDINLIATIVNKAIELYQNTQYPNNSANPPSSQESDRPAVSASGKARVVISKEDFKGSFDGFRLILIGDMHEQPMLHLKVKPFIIGAKDWTGQLHATATITSQISYWNLTNSHWEPLIDPWTLTFSVAKKDNNEGTAVSLSSLDTLDINLTTTFAEMGITTLNLWNKEGEFVLQSARGTSAPYIIRNRTGTELLVWRDSESSSDIKDSAVRLASGASMDWRFDDWKTMREHMVSSGQHTIGLNFVGKHWENLRGIPVDREGEFVFSLRPRTEKHANRLLCEVAVVDNIKVITLRSTYKIENLTLYPLEFMLVDEAGQPVHSVQKIAPGQDYSLPIEAVTQNRLRIQPDQGFGYKWCSAIRWTELLSKKSFPIRCSHTDPKEAAFRFQAWVQTDAPESGQRTSPKINLKLRAPLELENLLPYNLQYRIYDKDTDQNWRSYLRMGGIMPVHSVELSHFVMLNIEVQDTVFKPSDFAIINTDGHSDFDRESRIILRDQQDRKLDLRLHYIRYPDSGGAFKVQIYSPYLVVNKTGLPFAVKSTRSTRAGSSEAAGDLRPEIVSTTQPFMLSHSHDKGHDFIFKVDDSAWSKSCSVEAPAAETALVIPSQQKKLDEYHIGLSWSEGQGKYKLTKVITLTPRFLVKNSMTEPICFREHGVGPRERSLLNPGETCPLQLLRKAPERLLVVAFPGLDTHWSPPFNIEDLGTVYFRIRSPSDPHTVRLARTDVQIEGSTIFVTLSSAGVDWPFSIVNESDVPFQVSQTTQRDENGNTKANPVYTVKAHESLSYAWDFPAARDKKLLLSTSGSRRVVDVLEIGAHVPFKFTANQRSRVVSLDVRVVGQQQVLRITNYNAEQSLYKPRVRSSSSLLSRQDTVSTNADAFEAVTENVQSTMTFQMDLAGIGISLVNRRMVEVLYLTVASLRFEYSSSNVAQSVTLSCGTLQIDNQLHDALYPVVLQPTPLAKESNGVAPSPTVQMSIIWLNDQDHGVLFVKYCSVLLQALTIEADEDLLFAIFDLIQIKGTSWEKSDDVLIAHPEQIPEPGIDAAGSTLYFEVLELQPIQLSLSFMRTERVSSEEQLSIRNPFAVVVNALTMAVGNINDAPLEMNALAIKDMRLSMPELQNRIVYHYRQDVLRQLYRILGAADFIGNPVGLFTNVSSGVADIFYEPFNGVVHGNKDLGIGIAKGAASFVKKTVFGVSDSVTKFTSSVGKGLSAATFDSEYQARRRMTQRRNRPRHAIYGVTAGGGAFASSVSSAVEGVLMKPIEGAESEGALGFFKGIGKGLVGVVTKPVVGVFDLASNVSEGIRNTTTVFDNPDRERVRLPRHVSVDGVLVPFSAREAQGQYWMKDLNDGLYRREVYVAHINLPNSDNVTLLTASRVLSFWSKKLRLEWELPFTQVQGVTVEDTGIRFAHKAGKDQDKFAFIPDKAAQSWFFSQIATVVKAFNTRRRMDA